MHDAVLVGMGQAVGELRPQADDRLDVAEPAECFQPAIRLGPKPIPDQPGQPRAVRPRERSTRSAGRGSPLPLSRRAWMRHLPVVGSEVLFLHADQDVAE